MLKYCCAIRLFIRSALLLLLLLFFLLKFRLQKMLWPKTAFLFLLFVWLIWGYAVQVMDVCIVYRPVAREADITEHKIVQKLLCTVHPDSRDFIESKKQPQPPSPPPKWNQHRRRKVFVEQFVWPSWSVLLQNGWTKPTHHFTPHYGQPWNPCSVVKFSSFS